MEYHSPKPSPPPHPLDEEEGIFLKNGCNGGGGGGWEIFTRNGGEPGMGGLVLVL